MVRTQVEYFLGSHFTAEKGLAATAGDAQRASRRVGGADLLAKCLTGIVFLPVLAGGRCGALGMAWHLILERIIWLWHGISL
ncbi:hypothetical protein HHA02_30380 [Cobetia marina]|nr:hypothetical protein HHA02_30380 [Cobetia marina]